MKAVIPVAKKKDSMFPFSETRPTGLMPVMGKSLVSHLITTLQKAGVDDIYLVTNYKEEKFEEVFEEFTNVNLVTQKELSGTANAVACCDFIQEDFFVVNGDVMVSGRDVEELLQKHESSDGAATMLATDRNQPEKFGVLSITDDRVTGIKEKPEEAGNTLVNTGIYVFNPEIFDHIEKADSGELTKAVEVLIQNRKARFQMVKDYWFDIGSPKKLLKADRVKRNHATDPMRINEEADVSEGAEIRGRTVIEKGAVVKNGSYVKDSYVGRGSVIGPGTTVKSSSISSGCEIENSSIDSSILFEKSILEPSTAVKGSIIGEEAEIRSGTVVRESFIGPQNLIEINNSIRGKKTVPEARTDVGEITK